MIDIHTHLGRGVTQEPPVTTDVLLARMDELGIAQAVVLPRGVSPECSFFHFTTEMVLEACRRHPDRLIPFYKADPRNGRNSPDTDFSWVLAEYREAGCRGVGEVTANIPIDDPRYLNLFRQCGEAGLPVIIHLAARVSCGLYGPADDLGLPRLERVLGECPQTIIVGHAMAFWAEIAASANEATRGGYPTEPVGGPGRLWELLDRYPNLYGDLSAGSGFNAISRDPEFGYQFLERYQDRLLFGTDICHVTQEVPIVPWLRQARAAGKISEAAWAKITRGNAQRVLGLGSGG